MIPLYKINKILDAIKNESQNTKETLQTEEDSPSRKKEAPTKKDKKSSKQLVEPQTFVKDEDKKDFKILTIFVNSYKSKLMIRIEAGLKPGRGKKVKE